MTEHKTNKLLDHSEQRMINPKLARKQPTPCTCRTTTNQKQGNCFLPPSQTRTTAALSVLDQQGQGRAPRWGSTQGCRQGQGQARRGWPCTVRYTAAWQMTRSQSGWTLLAGMMLNARMMILLRTSSSSSTNMTSPRLVSLYIVSFYPVLIKHIPGIRHCLEHCPKC